MICDTPEKMELRQRVFNEQIINRIASLNQPRKMKQWIADKEGIDSDYSSDDAEGHPKKDE